MNEWHRENRWPAEAQLGLYILYLKCNGLFVETTLRASGTEQEQEEGGKQAMKPKFVFSAMFDCVVLVIKMLTSKLGLCLSALL